MRICYPALLACIACASAWAQDVMPAQTEAAVPTSREQRRAELRSVLQGQHQILSGDPGEAAPPQLRHLSAQERAEIRRQLRQQRVAPQRATN